MGTSMGTHASGLHLFEPLFTGLVGTWWLNAQCPLQHANDVRAILVDPHASVLRVHVRAGVAHLLGNPVH